jgi:hypothetical protein
MIVADLSVKDNVPSTSELKFYDHSLHKLFDALG